MFSLDVTALYPSIPTDYACLAIRNLITNSPTPPPFSIDLIIDLVRFCMDNNYFMFDNKFYKQIVGTAMGSPASVMIAELVLQYIENDINSQLSSIIIMWQRYVDDVFVLSNHEDCETILNLANSYSSNIQFTCEKEVNHCLNFLDISISFEPTLRIFNTTVYRKSTHTSRYLNFLSISPMSHKFNTVKTLINRAVLFCNSDDALKKELNLIKSDLLKNNYPKRWLFKSIDSIIKAKRSSSSSSITSPRSNYKYVSLPYYPRLSESVTKILRKFNIYTSYVSINKISSFFKNHLPLNSPYAARGVVYKINCSICDASYIGETKRQAQTRIKEHKKSLLNSTNLTKLTLHAMDKNHPPDFTNVEILEKNASNYYERTFLEAWHTRTHKCPLNEAALIPGEYHALIQP